MPQGVAGAAGRLLALLRLTSCRCSARSTPTGSEELYTFPMSTIGILNEKPLHASLKAWYAQAGDQFEVPVDGYVIDIVRDDWLFEIQTGHFAPLRSKLDALTRTHRVRLIYPVAQEKWIVKQAVSPPDSVDRRKSPKRGRVEDLFRELVSFPHFLARDNFSIEVLLTREEETRRYVGRQSWRKRGWRTDGRTLLEVVDRQLFESPGNCLDLLPSSLDQAFTTQNLAEALGIKRQLAQKMAYCLREMKMIQAIGKHKRAVLYEIAHQQ